MTVTFLYVSCDVIVLSIPVKANPLIRVFPPSAVPHPEYLSMIGVAIVFGVLTHPNKFHCAPFLRASFSWASVATTAPNAVALVLASALVTGVVSIAYTSFFPGFGRIRIYLTYVSDIGVAMYTRGALLNGAIVYVTGARGVNVADFATVIVESVGRTPYRYIAAVVVDDAAVAVIPVAVIVYVLVELSETHPPTRFNAPYEYASSKSCIVARLAPKSVATAAALDDSHVPATWNTSAV